MMSFISRTTMKIICGAYLVFVLGWTIHNLLRETVAQSVLQWVNVLVYAPLLILVSLLVVRVFWYLWVKVRMMILEYILGDFF